MPFAGTIDELWERWFELISASDAENPYIDPFTGMSLISLTFRNGCEDIGHDMSPATILAVLARFRRLIHFMPLMERYFDPENEINGNAERCADDQQPDLKIIHYVEQIFVGIIFSEDIVLRRLFYRVHSCLVCHAEGSLSNVATIAILKDIYTRVFEHVATTDRVISEMHRKGFLFHLIPFLVEYNFQEGDLVAGNNPIFLAIDFLYSPTEEMSHAESYRVSLENHARIVGIPQTQMM